MEEAPEAAKAKAINKRQKVPVGMSLVPQAAKKQIVGIITHQAPIGSTISKSNRLNQWNAVFQLCCSPKTTNRNLYRIRSNANTVSNVETTSKANVIINIPHCSRIQKVAKVKWERVTNLAHISQVVTAWSSNAQINICLPMSLSVSKIRFKGLSIKTCSQVVSLQRVHVFS